MTPENPSASLIIAVWNRCDDLRITLDCYRQQTLTNFETIVVDNGSSDGTVQMVRDQFPEVHLIQLLENIGIAAYNRGMQAARGEIVVVSDSDAVLEPTALERLVDRFHRYPRLAAAACEVVDVSTGDTYRWYLDPIDRTNPPDAGYPAHLFIGAGAGLRRSVLEQVGYFPEDFFIYMNEVDLATRILAAGYEVRYFPDIKSYHWYSSQVRSRDRNHYYALRNIIWYYWRYFPWRIALLRSIIRIPFEIISGLFLGTHPTTLCRAVGDTLKGLPRIIRTRQPIPKAVVRQALGNRSELNILAYNVWIWWGRKRKQKAQRNNLILPFDQLQRIRENG